MYLRPVPRQQAYAADVTYATNNELGFDYLRDNMVTDLKERVMRDRYFAVVDEVDNILIDEARTPLIISGQAEESGDLYYTFARLVPRLKPRPEGEEEGGDYFIDLKEHAVSPTEEGIDRIEKLLGVAGPLRRHRGPAAARATSSRRCAPTRCTSATATTSSRTARSSSSTSSRAARCPAAAGRRASTRPSRPRRACASSASR